mgnify:CR=1 FL=1
MSQASLSIANGAGAVVRAAINAAIQALTTCNSGATEPSPTYPNMLWFDTSTGLLKQRTNADDGWTEVALNAVDTDGALAANSDTKIASQKAAKTYSDTKISKSTAGEINALTEKTTLVDNDLFLIEDSASSNAKKKAKKSSLLSISGYTEKTAPVDNDLVLIEDSEDSNAKKKVKKSNLAPATSGKQIFTSSGTFTAPAGVTKVLISGIGAGGGGGQGGANSCGAGGGAGQCVMNYPYTVTPGNTYTVTINPGGTSNQNGGTSVFGTLTLAGGRAGGTGNSAGGAGHDPDASQRTLGSFGIPTGSGGNGYTATDAYNGAGGSSPFGLGGGGGYSAANAAANTGAGGSGGESNHNGYNGGSGIIIVEY